MGVGRSIVVALVMLVLAAGCRWPWEPEAVLVRGTVRYPDGTRAVVARVEVASDGATFTDWEGRYTLLVKAGAADTVTIVAYDFCRGACTETRAGSARVALRGSPMTVNIVLDEANPI